MGSFIANPGVRLVSGGGAASRPKFKPPAAPGLVYASTFSYALGATDFFDHWLAFTLSTLAKPLDDHDTYTYCHSDHADS